MFHGYGSTNLNRPKLDQQNSERQIPQSAPEYGKRPHHQNKHHDPALLLALPSQFR